MPIGVDLGERKSCRPHSPETVAPVVAFAGGQNYTRGPIPESETEMNDDFSRTAALIAAEIGSGREQAAAAIRLLDEGSTVPFIARYRKEATGGLGETQLRLLAERLAYLRELDARRAAI